MKHFWNFKIYDHLFSPDFVVPLLRLKSLIYIFEYIYSFTGNE